jgi:hypothetical protein
MKRGTVMYAGEDSAKYIQHEVASMKLFHHPNLLHCLAAFVVSQEVRRMAGRSRASTKYL